MSRDYKKLQNGSDIRGVAMPGVEGEEPNLGQAEAEHLASAFLKWLSEKTGEEPEQIKVAVGYDPRLSGKKLMQGILKGLVPYGVTVLNCGLASTPAMFMATVFPEFNCHGAIMITASHLPFNRNGFKYFDKEGGLNKKDITKIISYAESDEELSRLGERNRGVLARTGSGESDHEAVRTNLMDVYCEFLKDKIKAGVKHPQCYEMPLKGLKIVVDAGNGGGGFYAERVLRPLGADISASQFLEPDGTFPNHAPNPEDKAAMESVCKRVLENQADLGLIFDTDVDRSSAVDHKGHEISRNGIVALASALVAEEHPGTTVVTDSITSDQLTVFLEKNLGLKHRRFKRGYKNVINEAVRLNSEGTECQLAIETSGHAALKENYFLDDGAYLAAKIVIKTAKLAAGGRTLSSLISELKEPAEAVEVRMPITCEDFAAYGDRIIDDFRLWTSMKPCARRNEEGYIVPVEEEGCCLCHCGMSIVEPNYEGVRVNFDEEHGDGWCLLRKSLHDPIMPLNIESNREGGCRQIAEKLRPFLEAYKDLDIHKL
ncbi:phosphohexomutase domain-containing protein [Aminipila luticellarii]|uniref:Phosphomannomutase/phosphoglucomutase n=1 Tax=Aminipila luticellarii TaxID=2507160 RepID=A0A410PXJ0_9FIRM|nr:phosphomannomutase/phosphoglucomutase [Aminipila luticellarii]QAT43604.1 phosphomannomutase/phosphoglucomutase [Aminipila luticellarii]